MAMIAKIDTNVILEKEFELSRCNNDFLPKNMKI